MKRKQALEEVQSPPPDFHPSIEWLAAFRDQFDAALVALSVEYASELDAGIGSDKQNSKRYAREVVIDALTDTQLGILRWDHTTKLKDHIEKSIRKRSEINWKRASKRPERRFLHLRIDEQTASGRSYAVEEVDRLEFERLTDREKASEALDELRARAADDPDLLGFIEARCYDDSKDEIVRQLQLSPERYRQMLRRLKRLTKDMSIEAHPRRDNEEDTP